MKLSQADAEKRKSFVFKLHNENPSRPSSEIQALVKEKFGKLVHPNKIKSLREEAQAILNKGGAATQVKRKPGRPPKHANGAAQHAKVKPAQITQETAPAVQTSLPKEVVEALKSIQASLDVDCAPNTRALLSIYFTKSEADKPGHLKVEFRKEYIATVGTTVEM